MSEELSFDIEFDILIECSYVVIKGSEKNKKRDVNQYYRSRDDIRNRDDFNAPPGRGDIPIIHGDCDGECFKFRKTVII